MWYFQTREGTSIGPYEDRVDAKRALAVFLASKLQGLPDNQFEVSGEAIGTQDDIQFMVEELAQFYRSRSDGGDTAALAWANNRIVELRKDWKIACQKERIDVLYYAMNLIGIAKHR
jgi:hypothetical protein